MDFAADKTYKDDFEKDEGDFEDIASVNMEKPTEEDPKMKIIEEAVHKLFNIMHMLL